MSKLMPHGVQHPSVIDVVAHDANTDEVALVMHEARAWDGSDGRLFQLQEKINAYLSFALDGEMAEAYPALVGKAIRLQLDCATAPDVRTLEFIDVVRRQIAYQGIKFEIRITDGKTCGRGPACRLEREPPCEHL